MTPDGSSLVTRCLLICFVFTLSEEGILRDTERVEDGIRTVDSPKIVTNASNIARRANRVLQVAQQEAENSEDPAFVDNVNRASEQLRSSEWKMERE